MSQIKLNDPREGECKNGKRTTGKWKRDEYFLLDTFDNLILMTQHF